jgi:hypothetical protein
MFARSRRFQDRVRVGEFDRFLVTCAHVAWDLACAELDIERNALTFGDLVDFLGPMYLHDVETRVFAPALRKMRSSA